MPAGPGAEPSPSKTRFDNEAIAPYFFVVLFILALLAVGYVLRPFLGDMVIAFLFVILLTPLCQRLTRVLGNRQVLASGIVVIGMVVVGAIPIFLIASALLRDIAEASSSWASAGRSLTLRAIAGRNGVIMSGISNIAERLGITLAPEWMEQALLDTGRSLTQYLATRANAFLSSILSTALHGIIILFSIFYLLIHGDQLAGFPLPALAAAHRREPDLPFQAGRGRLRHPGRGRHQQRAARPGGRRGLGGGRPALAGPVGHPDGHRRVPAAGGHRGGRGSGHDLSLGGRAPAGRASSSWCSAWASPSSSSTGSSPASWARRCA